MHAISQHTHTPRKEILKEALGIGLLVRVVGCNFDPPKERTFGGGVEG